MRNLAGIITGVFAFCVSQMAFSASTQWAADVNAPTIYYEDQPYTSYFTRPGWVLTSQPIMKVSWNFGKYWNGSTAQAYELCYRETPSSSKNCLDVSSMASAGSTMHFAGLSTGGNFSLDVTLHGGAYPATAYHSYGLTVQYSLD